MGALRRLTKLIQKGLLLGAFLVPSCSVLSQTFEGKVTYIFKLKNGHPSAIPDSIYNLMYNDSEAPIISYTYYYKANKYKSVRNNDEKSVQVYEPTKNRIYSYNEGDEFAFYSDGDQATAIEQIDETETILGMECKAIKITSMNSEVTFYYPSNYRIDTSTFTETSVWETYLKIAGSLPLKYIIKGNGAPHAIVLTAISVKEEKLADDFFRIPKFKQIMKSQF
jgi:hypothetical protein